MYCVSFKQALAVFATASFIDTELILKSSCSHPFSELPFFYYKRVIAATHSFKFTMFLQNRNCSKETLTIIIIPPWFQACIYWKKFVSWRHHFQPSIFFNNSFIISQEHLKKSTCQEKCVYFTILFATIHYNRWPVIDSRKSWRVCLFQENHCGPALLKVSIYSTKLVAIIFFEKHCVKCLKALAEILFFHGEPAKHSAVSKG